MCVRCFHAAQPFSSLLCKKLIQTEQTDLRGRGRTVLLAKSDLLHPGLRLSCYFGLLQLAPGSSVGRTPNLGYRVSWQQNCMGYMVTTTGGREYAA